MADIEERKSFSLEGSEVILMLFMLKVHVSRWLLTGKIKPFIGFNFPIVTPDITLAAVFSIGLPPSFSKVHLFYIGHMWMSTSREF